MLPHVGESDAAASRGSRQRWRLGSPSGGQPAGRRRRPGGAAEPEPGAPASAPGRIGGPVSTADHPGHVVAQVDVAQVDLGQQGGHPPSRGRAGCDQGNSAGVRLIGGCHAEQVVGPGAPRWRMSVRSEHAARVAVVGGGREQRRRSVRVDPGAGFLHHHTIVVPAPVGVADRSPSLVRRMDHTWRAVGAWRGHGAGGADRRAQAGTWSRSSATSTMSTAVRGRRTPQMMWSFSRPASTYQVTSISHQNQPWFAVDW